MFHISGRVIRGKGFGRKVGFPTANLDRRQYVRLSHKPRLGIYGGEAILGSKRYKTGIVIGPLDNRGLPAVEAHLIGFSGNLYGRKLSLNLVKYLRPFRSYKTTTELKSAIARDLKQIKRLKFNG